MRQLLAGFLRKEEHGRANLVEFNYCPSCAAFLAYAYAVAGKTRQALEILDELNEMPGQRRLPSYEIAAVHAALGRKDQAFAWLEKAYVERHPNLLGIKIAMVFDPLRSDPRFQDLLRRMNFPE